MWWECGECGGRIVRERPPAVCAECGRASSSFVRAEPAFEGDDGVSSPRAAWIRAGAERGAFRECADVRWTESR